MRLKQPAIHCFSSRVEQPFPIATHRPTRPARVLTPPGALFGVQRDEPPPGSEPQPVRAPPRDPRSTYRLVVIVVLCRALLCFVVLVVLVGAGSPGIQSSHPAHAKHAGCHVDFGFRGAQAGIDVLGGL